jgi:hypothetical protein
VAGVYEKTMDRESAFEKLKGRAPEAEKSDTAKRRSSSAAPAAAATEKLSLGQRISGRQRLWVHWAICWAAAAGDAPRAGEQLFKSAASAIGREVGRQIIRGVLGGIFGGKR